MHSCGRNISIIATRNAWVGYSVCLCVMGDKELCRAMEGGGIDWIEKGLRNGRRKVSIKGNMEDKGRGFFLLCNFFLVFVVLKLLI